MLASLMNRGPLQPGATLQVPSSVRGVWFTDAGQAVEQWMPGGLYRVVRFDDWDGRSAVIVSGAGREWWLSRPVVDKYCTVYE